MPTPPMLLVASEMVSPVVADTTDTETCPSGDVAELMLVAYVTARNPLQYSTSCTMADGANSGRSISR
jgi:hypothetical protein